MEVLASGGRVVQLQQQQAPEPVPSAKRQGLGQWLFSTGLEQIEREQLPRLAIKLPGQDIFLDRLQPRRAVEPLERV